MKCPQCGKENPPDNRFCDNCGLELATATVPAATTPTPTPTPPAPPKAVRGTECPSCKHVNPADSTFCEQCGADLAAQPPTPAPVPAPVPAAPGFEGILVLPDGKELLIGTKKTLGRVDLAKYASPAEASWVSRQHFSIFIENGTFYIQDDGSTNGTKLNGTEIRNQGKQPLKDGDEILVADVVKLMFKEKS